jgi:hypothetical protein
MRGVTRSTGLAPGRRVRRVRNTTTAPPNRMAISLKPARYVMAATSATPMGSGLRSVEEPSLATAVATMAATTGLIPERSASPVGVLPYST